MNKFIRLSIVLNIAISAVHAATVNTPSLTACQASSVTFSGAKGMVHISVLPGKDPSAASIKTLPDTQAGTDGSGSVLWNPVDIKPNTQVTLKINDDSGVPNYSSQINVLPGSSCDTSGFAGDGTSGGMSSSPSTSASSTPGASASSTASETSGDQTKSSTTTSTDGQTTTKNSTTGNQNNSQSNAADDKTAKNSTSSSSSPTSQSGSQSSGTKGSSAQTVSSSQSGGSQSSTNKTSPTTTSTTTKSSSDASAKAIIGVQTCVVAALFAAFWSLL